MDDVTLEAPELRQIEASDRQRFASRIRTTVHDAVEGALAEMNGSTDARSALRMAGQKLGNALAAHVEASPSPCASRAVRGSGGETVCAGAREARAGRARAFRRMAGVH